MPPPVAPLPLSLVTLVLGAGAVAVAPPAAALCAAVTLEEFVADADSLVVAEVERSDEDRADLLVEEVWSGPDRPERLTVVTGQLRPGVSSSADIRLREGWHYLVDLDGDPPSTNACAVMTVDDEAAVAAVRPADARDPVVEEAAVVGAGDPDAGSGADGADDAGPPVAAALGTGALALAVVGAGAVVLRRRRGPRRG